VRLGSGPTASNDRAPESIRSAANPIVKYVRSLERRSIRWRERAFVVEGARAVADALVAGAVPTIVLVREGDPDPFDERLLPAGQADVRSVSPALFDQLAGTVHPQGVLAVFATPVPQIPKPRVPLFVVVDGLRDPGNLGTLLRSAVGAGATAAVLTPGTVDPFNPKVVRAAMGAHFRLPIVAYDELIGDEIRAATALRAVARVGDHTPYDAVDWRQPATLIVTAETGVESLVGEDLATREVAIPMAAGMESLNAAVAASVILFEAARQRRGSRGGAVAPSKPG
jgi:TrmH family RNA methyltransferase